MTKSEGELLPCKYIPEDIYMFLEKLKKLALSMPPPNPYTPQFIQLAIKLAESVARTQQPDNQPAVSLEK